jgi:hypothetical protein
MLKHYTKLKQGEFLMKETECKVRGRVGLAQRNLMCYMENNGGKIALDPNEFSPTMIKRMAKMLDGLVKRGLVKFVQLKKSSYYKLV